MTVKLLPNKTIPSPIVFAVQMLCLNLALLEEGKGSKIEVVKPINTERSWELKGLVDALDQLTEEKLHTAHSAPPGYYDNLYGFREGYDSDQHYGGPAVIRDRAYNKVLFPNKPVIGSEYSSPYYTNQKIDRNCCGRFQTPEEINHGTYYRGFYKPGHQKRFHYPYHITKTPNHYQDFIYKNRAAVPYSNHGYKYTTGGSHSHISGHNYGASIYSNLLIPSYRNNPFVQTGKRTGVYLVPSPQNYYVDNVSKNKNSTVTSKPMDISTLILSLNNASALKDEIQLENVKRKIN